MAEEEDIRLKMDPTSVLPPTVAESIFKLLPIKDILSCCLVSSSWREAVNTDIIWKPFCNVDINLENVPCVINHKCQNPQNEHLTSVCGNRLKYMRGISLRNNFKNNRCVDYQISMNSLVGVSSFQFVNNYRYLILNDVIGGFCKNSFEVWDMEHDQAPFHVQTIPHLLKQDKNDTFLSLGDCLLIIQGNLFQRYTVVEGKLTLKFCRVSNREESFSQSIPARGNIQAWYSENVRSKTPGFKSEIEAIRVADKYLFCLFRSLLPNISLNTSVIHIWDWDSGNKLKIERLPQIPEIIEKISFEKNSEYLYIFLFHLSCTEGYNIYSYDLKRLQYTKFYLVLNYLMCCFVTEERIVVFHYDENLNCQKYTILDSITGNFIAQKDTEHLIYPRIVESNDSVLAFYSGNTVATVTVVDLRTSKEVAVLKVSMVPTTLYFVESNLLLVCGSSAGNDSLEVWDIKKRCKLYRMKNTLLAACGRALLRLSIIRHNKLHVLNYW